MQRYRNSVITTKITEKWNLRPETLSGNQIPKGERQWAKPAAQRSRLKILDTRPDIVYLLNINRDLGP